MTRREASGEDALPPEEEAVRRLLADVRASDPAPPEVVARLDAALADLAEERFGPAPGGLELAVPGAGARVDGRTDELTARRRQRERRRRASVAAAAVVAVVGLGGVVLGGGGGIDAVTSADSGAGESATTAEVPPQEETGDGAGDAGNRRDDAFDGAGGAADLYAPESGDGLPEPDAGSRTEVYDLEALSAQVSQTPRLSERRFLPQVRRLLRAPVGTSLDTPRRTGEAPDRSTLRSSACRAAAGEVRRGDEVVAVRYEGTSAQLVVRDPEAEESVVDLYVCGQRGIVRSVLVRLR